MLRPRLAVVLVVMLAAGACSSHSRVAGRPADRATTSTSSTSTSSTASTTTTTTFLRVAAQAATPSCPPIPQRAEPSPTRPSYVLDLQIDPSAGKVEGRVSVRFTPDLPTDKLLFRLWPNGPRPAAGGGHLDTGQVMVGAHPVSSSKPNATTLQVPVNLGPGQGVDVVVPFSLTLPGAINDRVAKAGDSLRLGSFFPILAWEPGLGWDTEPAISGFAEASSAPIADFRASIAVPDGYQVLATGIPDGRGRWTALSVRDFALSVGHFTEVSGTAMAPQPVAVTVGVAQGINESPQTYLSKIIKVLEAHAQRFGPYPWAAYTVAITSNLKGGIEYPMHVMQGPGTIGRTTTHEAGHEWFYALVGNNQGRDPFLDEGLATYAEGRYEGSIASFLARAIPAEGRGRAGAPMSYWE
ncbi:MAG: hypothetical protein QOG03_1350, partial [Actinomycetota bacterium]|nr:hypothetical protein [Actinomycetota bacterium]